MKKQSKRKPKRDMAERKIKTKRMSNVSYKKMVMGLGLWIFVVWLFFGQGVLRHINISEGQRAPSNITADVDFDCEDLSETAFVRTKARAAVPPVFVINPIPLNKTLRLFSELFNRLEKHAKASSKDEAERIERSINDLLIGSSVGLTGKDLIEAIPSNQIVQIKKSLLFSIKKVMEAGILSETSRKIRFYDTSIHSLMLADQNGTTRKTVPQESVYSLKEATHKIAASISNKKARKVIENILSSVIEENLTYNEVITKELRKKASDNVAPVIKHYSAGSTLIRAGESVTTQTLLLLLRNEEARKKSQDRLEQFFEVVGNAILLLAGLIAILFILHIVAPKVLSQSRQIFLLILLCVISLTLARVLMYLSSQYAIMSSSLLMYLLPQALTVLLAGILLDARAAICLGLWISFATAVLFDQSFNVFALSLFITVAATGTARNIHRRSSLFHAGLWVCAIKVLFVLISAIFNKPVFSVVIGQVVASILSGMLSASLALLLIPFFEKLFKITTDITLLELSDMGNPLLQKMAIQAPGTYHHSLMVATLAQTAAEAIGANSLLVRVCAYYHDIGKMAKPEFFTENIQQKENPHDELSPHMSALIISSHVKEGLALARRNKLPQPILDGIEQHHGNGLIGFFYQKAMAQKEDSEVINDADFRYGGPPAVSPEMAILALADTAEAASRSLEKPSLPKIESLMNDLFAAKIKDGLLDHAELTLAQINDIKAAFVFSLSNMLHGRIPYPKDHENNTSQSTKKRSSTSETHSDVDELAK